MCTIDHLPVRMELIYLAPDLEGVTCAACFTCSPCLFVSTVGDFMCGAGVTGASRFVTSSSEDVACGARVTGAACLLTAKGDFTFVGCTI